MSDETAKRYKIFISSTMTDLQDVRDAVADTILQLGHEPVRAEIYPAQPTSSREVVLQMVQEADILLGIYVSRYGYVPPGEKISVIEMEFEAAKQLGKEILIYVAKAESRQSEMEGFLRRVEDFDTGWFRRPHFTTTEQLIKWIKEDISDLIEGPKFHLFTFKEYARRLSTWTLKYKESSWGGRYTELMVKSMDILLYARRRGIEHAGSTFISEVIDHNQVVLIVGEAGSGKTTALLHAIKAEAERVVKNQNGKVPVFVALNAWTEGQDLEALILSSLASLGKHLDRQVLHTYLSGGRFLLAFDGINEIPYQRRARNAERELAVFIEKNAQNHILVTTRPVGYEPKVFESWPIFEIQPLDRESILTFVRMYLGDDLGKRLFQRLGGEESARWQKAHSLITLARNPLHLWMLTETYQQFNDVPQNRGALIKSFTEFILQARERGKASRYGLQVKNHLLRALAFEMIEAGEIVRTTQEKALRILSATSNKLKDQGLLEPQVTVLDLLDEIRANGLIHLENSNSAHWNHQLFQEFFGALDLVHRFEAGISIWRQLNSADWKESAVMGAGLTSKPEQYVNEVLNGWRGFIGLFFFENPRALLAINCINETQLWDNEELRKKIIAAARSRLATGLNQRLLQFGGVIFSRIGKPFSRLFLRLAKMPFGNYYVLGPVLWVLGESHESRALTILTSKLRSPDRVIRWVAADALRKLKDPTTINDLVEALGDYDGDVRWQAIQALINIGDARASSAIVPLLNHSDPTTRWAAAFALGEIGTPANLPDLEAIRNTDHAFVWWGESVSQAAGIAMGEIQRRSSAKETLMVSDMGRHIYYGAQNN
ncbi:MAG: HEAT repeat domain-containing protein [Chloroflexi bacterium]|nr:HEAT repeat domain-containing protein [Chloroflexota bacterium]